MDSKLKNFKKILKFEKPFKVIEYIYIFNSEDLNWLLHLKGKKHIQSAKKQ